VCTGNHPTDRSPKPDAEVLYLGGAVVKENMENVAYPFPDPESFSWTLDTSIIKAYHDWQKGMEIESNFIYYMSL
jgi:hypothetical protein